jgi:exosortase/archaeosortase family protein
MHAEYRISNATQGWRADAPEPGPSAPKSHPLRSAFIFVLVFALLQGAWTAARDTGVERFIIDTCTAQPAAALVRLIQPDVPARAVGSRITAPGGGINIIGGCEGTEVLFLLVAAFMAFPMRWRDRATAIALAVPVIWSLNQARTVTLFIAFRQNREMFDLLHAYLAPIALIVASVLYFLVWTKLARRSAFQGAAVD